MSLGPTQIEKIENVIKESLRRKFETYSPETNIAIPYNPYEPKPYERWTLKGMIDIKHELKVAEEFWDFLGGTGAYEGLLDCFERVGIELRPEIDIYFKKFR